MKTIKGAVAAAVLGAGLLAAAPHAAATPLHAGPCLLGHVNPHDPNSGCRYGDKQYPIVPGDPNGVPRLRCGPENDGHHVTTEDAVGGKHAWICEHITNIQGEEYWEWTEILLGRTR